MQFMNQPQNGSLWGGIILLTGCSVGAGMLGLPLISAQFGVIPSLLWLALTAAFMICTGLFLLEATLWFKKETNLLSILERTLGPKARWLGFCLFVLLFMCLMIAYTSATGSLLVKLLGVSVGLEALFATVAVLLIAIAVFFGVKIVDRVNQLLVFALIAAYVLLISLGLPQISHESLMRHQWSSSWLVLPVMVTSFGFHNLIPSLSNYLKRDSKRLSLAILGGGLLPLIIYALWQVVILGVLSQSDAQNAADKDILPDLLSGTGAQARIAQLLDLFHCLQSPRHLLQSR
jgi:Amino acid permeases